MLLYSYGDGLKGHGIAFKKTHAIPENKDLDTERVQLRLRALQT